MIELRPVKVLTYHGRKEPTCTANTKLKQNIATNAVHSFSLHVNLKIHLWPHITNHRKPIFTQNWQIGSVVLRAEEQLVK